jgi:hypothetical protein
MPRLRQGVDIGGEIAGGDARRARPWIEQGEGAVGGEPAHAAPGLEAEPPRRLLEGEQLGLGAHRTRSRRARLARMVRGRMRCSADDGRGR